MIGRAIEELITIVSTALLCRRVREETYGKAKPKNPEGAEPQPKELNKTTKITTKHNPD